MNPFLKLKINKIEDIVECLNELCLEQKIITGYNGYFKLPRKDDIPLRLSNIYEGKSYQKDMINGLESINFQLDDVTECIRGKIGFYEWKTDWSLVDYETNKVKNVNIKRVGSEDYINLTEFVSKFGDYLHMSKNYNKNDRFVADDKNLEINLPIKNKNELVDVVDLFVEKYSINKFNCLGKVIGEATCHWKGAWATPVLLIEGEIFTYENTFSCFRKVTKVFKKENGNEISFHNS